MTSSTIRVEYERLEDIAGRFLALQENLQSRFMRLADQQAKLMRGAWEGESAERFYQVMDNEITPSLRRVLTSLEDASATTRDIVRLFQEAEEEAGSKLQFDGDVVVTTRLANASLQKPLSSDFDLRKSWFQQQRQEVCGIGFEGAVNIRATPNGDVIIGNYDGNVCVTGRNPDTGWYRVRTDTNSISETEYGWMSPTLFSDPALDSLPLVDQAGEPIEATPPPTEVVPESHPTVEVLPTEAMPDQVASRDVVNDQNVAQLLTVTNQDEWERSLYDDAVSYLDEEQYILFVQMIENGSFDGLTYAQLDQLWIQTFGVGIADVPPQFWNQACTSPNCENVQAWANELYARRTSIGADGNGAPTIHPAIWPDGNGDLIFNPPDGAYCAGAESCFVCQDVVTGLLDRAYGVNIQAEMQNSHLGAGAGYPEYLSRNAESFRQYLGGQVYGGGSPQTYQVGNPVFLVDVYGDGSQFVYHVGLTVSVNGGSLSDIYIAQMSFSDQGYLSAYAGEGVGRFQVITLETYTNRQVAYMLSDPESSNYTAINDYITSQGWQPYSGSNPDAYVASLNESQRQAFANQFVLRGVYTPPVSP